MDRTEFELLHDAYTIMHVVGERSEAAQRAKRNVGQVLMGRITPAQRAHLENLAENDRLDSGYTELLALAPMEVPA